jgi:nucleoprotein TPR
VDKATSELRSAPSTTSEEVIKQHAEELRALEERLVAKHQEDLNKATEAAIAKVKESQPAPVPATGTAATPEDQKVATDAAITTALAAKEAELKAKHDAAIEKAVESGRLEGTMKLRLKDTQLVRAQNRVKELEKQIEEWKKAGVITSEAASESTSAPPASSSVPAAPTASTSALSPTTTAPPRAAPAGGGAAAGIPRKLSAAVAAAGQPARGRGRGVRGNIGIRGAAPSAGRGAGAPQGSAGAGSTAGGTAGVAIMGAASKRSREEGEVSTEDSLSKRMKPAGTSTTSAGTIGTATAADGSAGATSSSGKPVTLQRNRVQPP